MELERYEIEMLIKLNAGERGELYITPGVPMNRFNQMIHSGLLTKVCSNTYNITELGKHVGGHADV